MKKYKIIMLMYISVFTACTDINQEEVFDETASQRVEDGITKFSNLLVDSDQGWILEYFPESEQSYGGYNYIVKFNSDNDNVADVYSELQDNYSSPESTSYNLISRGGTVLTFDTYNPLMHFFAKPSSQLYQALGGDFEFNLLETEDGIIDALGTISGNNSRMIKLTESPQSYLSKVDDFRSYLKGKTLFYKDKKVIYFNRNLMITQENGENLKVPFIYTPTGIRFYKEEEMNGIKVSSLTLNKDKKQLISDDGLVVFKILSTPIDMYQDWSIDVDNANVSTSFYQEFVNAYRSNYFRWGHKLSGEIFIGNTTTNGSTRPGIMFWSISGSGSTYPAQYILSFSAVLGEPTHMDISKVMGGFFWSYFLHLLPLVDYIVDNAPYITVSNGDSEVKMTSTNNPDVWFIIKK